MKLKLRVARVVDELKDYLRSDTYEADLDRVIELLYIHNPSAQPNFLNFKTKTARVAAKMGFVRKQAVRYVGASALVGARFGPKGATVGALIATLTILLGVAFVVKRSPENYRLDSA